MNTSRRQGCGCYCYYEGEEKPRQQSVLITQEEIAKTIEAMRRKTGNRCEAKKCRDNE